MPDAKPASFSSPVKQWSSWLWVIGTVLALGLLGGAMFGLLRTQAAPPQPFPFQHAPHIAKGIPCQFCHSGANRGKSATIPTRSKCVGCHNNMTADKPALQAVADYLSKNENLAWTPVALMPDFVYFSHQPHIAASVKCETCHGDIGKMAAAQPWMDQNMGWCLSCHQRTAAAANDNADKFTRLSDCATCHK